MSDQKVERKLRLKCEWKMSITVDRVVDVIVPNAPPESEMDEAALAEYYIRDLAEEDLMRRAPAEPDLELSGRGYVTDSYSDSFSAKHAPEEPRSHVTVTVEPME